jgi:type VI protein secretion system component VasF
MAHPPYPHPDADPDAETRGQPRHRPGNATPRWVMVAGIIVAIAVVLLMVVLHATGVLGPGDH